VHLVVPDARTADILTSIADHLAGAELSRLRWENDRVMGRPALTFNGDPAQVPRPLSEQERIVLILDKFDALVNDISIGLPAELKARRQQYEYYRNKLL
jgi:hypothetical protein